MPTNIASFFMAKEVRLLAFILLSWDVYHTPADSGRFWSHHPIQGETLHPIMLREVCLKISEVLGHRGMSPVFPLRNIREVGDHLDSDPAFLFALHLGTDGPEVSGPKFLDGEIFRRPRNTPMMPAGPGGTLNAVLLQG